MKLFSLVLFVLTSMACGFDDGDLEWQYEPCVLTTEDLEAMSEKNKGLPSNIVFSLDAVANSEGKMVCTTDRLYWREGGSGYDKPYSLCKRVGFIFSSEFEGDMTALWTCTIDDEGTVLEVYTLP